jgi:hypothetical protein
VQETRGIACLTPVMSSPPLAPSEAGFDRSTVDSTVCLGVSTPAKAILAIVQSGQAIQAIDDASNTPSTIAAGTPSTIAIASTSSRTSTSHTHCVHCVATPTLAAHCHEGDVPTPSLIAAQENPAALFASPGTPQDLRLRPFAFSMSAGSHFATPEVPIATGMTPMTPSDARHAQKHIPAWNRVSRVVEKQAPLVYRQVSSLWAKPTGQHTWAKTPFLLLQAICATKGWQLTVRYETEVRIGLASSVIATVNVPAENGGKSFTGLGKNTGEPLVAPRSK